MIINHLVYIHNTSNHINTEWCVYVKKNIAWSLVYFMYKTLSLWKKETFLFTIISIVGFFLNIFAIICLTKFTYFTTQKRVLFRRFYFFFSHAHVNILKWMRQQSKKGCQCLWKLCRRWLLLQWLLARNTQAELIGFRNYIYIQLTGWENYWPRCSDEQGWRFIHI